MHMQESSMLILYICSILCYQSFVYLHTIIIITTTYVVYHIIISSVTIITDSICIVITDHVHDTNSLHFSVMKTHESHIRAMFIKLNTLIVISYLFLIRKLRTGLFHYTVCTKMN